MYAIPTQQERAWGPLLGTKGLKRVLNRKRYNKGVPIYPDVVSDSSACLRLTENLVDALNSEPALRVSVDATGVVGANAVAGDFNQLLTVAGYGMDPISTPPVDNTPICDALKLATGFRNARHRAIATALFRCMFGEAAPAKLSMRREASTGSPDYVNDVPKKKAEIRTALSGLDRYLSLVEKGDLISLFTEFNSPIVQTIGERTQADKVTIVNGRVTSKDREVNDELAARTAFKDGRRFPADKSVRVDGRAVDGHFAGRRRTVFGMSFVPNYVVAAVFSCFRVIYLDRYAFTWKHRAPDTILAKMRKFKYMAGFDVKQFDQSVREHLIEFFCSELERYADHRIAKLIRLMFRAPYIMPSPYIARADGERPTTNPLFGDNPFDQGSFVHNLGLPSGIACNPDFGKWAMMFQYLCVVDDHYHDVIEFGVDSILRGEHPTYAFLNMGDDCVILMNDERFHEVVVSGDYTADYFSVEPEHPISFLGNVPYRDDSGELQLAPNIVSFFVNWIVPEHGIDNHRRRNFWAVGDRERRQHYARAPGYSAAYAIYEEMFSSIFNRTPASITNDYYDQQRRLGSLSFIDALVLQKPEYLQYRFDEKDVSPEILDVLVTSLPEDEVWPLVKPFLRNTT